MSADLPASITATNTISIPGPTPAEMEAMLAALTDAGWTINPLDPASMTYAYLRLSLIERADVDPDLPAGYRWATSSESEAHGRHDHAHCHCIVVPRTADRNGTPYTQGEADLAVPL